MGTNSIGWALIDEITEQIIDTGVRIFPEGVNKLGEGNSEQSKNAARGEHRGSRRQFFRRRLRKLFLLKLLSKHNMTSIDGSSIKHWNLTDVSSSPEFIHWVRMNPYELRAKASKEKISLLELGRVFYHMSQRRGFLSNRKSQGSEDGKIYEGDAKSGKTGINDTQNSLKDYTLGEYLNQLHPQQNAPYKSGVERIRNRYTIRQMYIDEFETIWSVQEKHHALLDKNLKSLLGGRKKDNYPEDGALFFQLPLKSQKHLVGHCSLEPKKTRAQLSALPVDLFRIYQWVNTVECNGQKLSSDERESIIHVLLRKEKVLFTAIRKKINKLDGYYQFNYNDSDKIAGAATISKLCSKKCFGENWFEISEKEQEDIWHALYFFEDRDKLEQHAQQRWSLSEKQAQNISRISLKEGYASLSRKSIRNILPFLMQGYRYDLAVVLGGIKNAIGNSWDTIDSHKKQLIHDNLYDIVQTDNKGGFIENLRHFLKKEFLLQDKDLNKLYHHSIRIGNYEVLPKLPVDATANKEIQDIKNPVVVTALFELRKLVNEIIELYGKPDDIKVELARNLKTSKSGRNDIRIEQKRLEKENDRVKERLKEENQRPNHDNILKYKLWEECNKVCPYTGKSIGLTHLFSGEVQIEHIHPWSRSLNDSFANKTLCFADENRKKGNKTPYEFYSAMGEDKWNGIKDQALNCFKTKSGYPKAYFKFKHFVKTKHDDDFVSKQLNDTRYISKQAKQYLLKICTNVTVSQGTATAILRRKWGMNSILDEKDRKTRTDHRHHAIDAMVMSCTKTSYLQELSKWNRYHRNATLKEFPMPWDGFYHDAETAIGKILVSHRIDSRVITSRHHTVKKKDEYYTNKGTAARGPLHKENVYGKRKAPGLEEGFHIRKPIESLTTREQVNKVVDPNIKSLIHERIALLGGYINNSKVPPNAFYEINESGQSVSKILLPNKNGDGVPVKKVRLRETINNAVKLKEDNQYVNPRNNHHALIYKDEEGNLKEEIVSFWEAVERKKQGLEVIKLPLITQKGTVVATLKENDLFVMDTEIKNGDLSNVDQIILAENIYRVQNISKGDYNFRKHNAATLEDKDELVRITSMKNWQLRSPCKVGISSAGKITPIQNA